MIAPALSSAVMVASFCFLLIASVRGASGQEVSPEKFTEESLSFRTALHYDSMLDQPLDSLVRLYQNADRLDELVGLYRSHVEQYPDDAGAKAVLVRILRGTERPGVGELIASAVALHPEFPPLQYLLFELLEEKGDERSLDALSKAIDLQANPARRSEWLEELLKLSDGETARALAVAKLKELLEDEDLTGEAFLELARVMQRYSFWDLSRSALKQAIDSGLPAEMEVEAEVLLAKAEAELGHGAVAGGILDAILKKLAPDHWRRQEVMTTRVSVIASDEERESMLTKYQEAYQANPKVESTALEFAEMLVASGKTEEAAKVLVESAPSFSSGSAFEARALFLLEGIRKPEVLEAFLQVRLEEDPERTDLRFRLVKTYYNLGKDGDAEQDFKVVVAGMEAAEASDRILELQRYLRGIERIDAAGIYLEHYVRNHPDKLEVARELAEIYVALDRRSEIDGLVGRLDPVSATPESVGDLVEFLVAKELFVPARRILDAKLAEGGEQFQLGLLQIAVLGELGDATKSAQSISRMREMTDTPERYSQWLKAAVAANSNLEKLDSFFSNEQNRFSFANDEWPADKVEKFVILCEVGKQRLLTDSVAGAVRRQLAEGTFDAELKVRLRRFLVGMLESNPTSSAEVEEQLQLLEVEDPENKVQYKLQRALVYHRTQRIDQAQEILVGMDLTSVTDAGLVQQAVEVLVEYGFLKEAESALEAVNRLVPDDVFSWEKRLTLLAVLGEESDFRSVVRDLESGSSGLKLREDSLVSLKQHLAASYWRSISRLIATGDPRRFEEILPLLHSVKRDSSDSDNLVWAEWSEAIVLQSLGRSDESKEAMERLSSEAAERSLLSIDFPDGMSLSLSGAESLLDPVSGGGAPGRSGNSEFLLGESETNWIFEADAGSRIFHTEATEDTVLALDDLNILYAIDLVTGKLRWKERFGEEDKRKVQPPGLFFGGEQVELGESEITREQGVKIVRPFAVLGDTFFLFQDGAMNAFEARSGELKWRAPLPFSVSGESSSTAGARPGLLMAVEAGHAAAFHPDSGNVAVFDANSGKLLWHRSGDAENENSAGQIMSLNCGIVIDGNLLFAYGRESIVFDLSSGSTLWTLSGSSDMRFPVVLRKHREGEVGEELPPQAEPESTPDWSKGHSGNTPSTIALIDFLSSESAVSKGFLTDSARVTEMVNPAVHWSGHRLESGNSAMAILEEGYLWMMQEEGLRRISVRLPVASRTLPASGTFLGRVGNHAWFADGATLQHLDFSYDRTHSVDCRDLGKRVRCVLVGNQLVIRGDAGLKLVNALTGKVIGSTQWSKPIIDYLDLVKTRTTIIEKKADSLWQGEVLYSDSGEPGYCVPIDDIVIGSYYVTRFGNGTVVCLGKKTSPVTPSTPPGE